VLEGWRPEFPLGHERVPRPDIYVDGEPVYILGKGVVRERERSLQLLNIEVAEYMSEFLKTTFGPQGLDKIIIVQEGKSRITYVSNDAEMIFRKTPFQHPVAQFLAGAAVAAQKEVGGGGATSIILAGEILRNCGMLIKNGVHPSVIQDGCIEAMNKTIEIINQTAIPVNIADHKITSQIVKTSITSGCLLEFGGLIADMILKIIGAVNKAHLEDVLLNVKVKKVEGGWIGDSKLVMGCAFYREPTHPDMPERVTKAKIAILKGGLKIPERGRTRYLNHGITLEALHNFKEFRVEKMKLLMDTIEKISSTGANVLFVEKGIDQEIIDYLARSGILTIRRFPPPELEEVAEATGANIVSDVNILDASDLGGAELVELRRIAGEPWWFVEGCRNPKVVNLLLRGANAQLLLEAETAIKNIFKTISMLWRDRRVVAGGGALEMEIARRLREYSRQTPGKKQLVINAIADAFHSIPSALIQNAGLKPVDVLPDLRSKHAQGGVNIGFDVFKRESCDMVSSQVLEPVQVKIQAVKTAFEAVYTILRIDDLILCRCLPKPEADYKRRMEGTSPKRVKKIKRDFGID
ncbi:MAG: thermosome subunit beta, partial [Candidatus Bathyarchaeia archaeon]